MVWADLAFVQELALLKYLTDMLLKNSLWTMAGDTESARKVC
jgi:hypothetical protein